MSNASPVIPEAAEPPYLAGLNPEQRAAVTAPDGPLLVLAGAGTGKTRVLTTRLAHLLVTGRARPHEVLAVTFTNKAARELSERVERLIGRSVAGLWLGTFHAIGVRFLRAHAELAGLQSSFTILDTDDQLRLIKQVVQAAGLDEKRWAPRILLAIIQRWKDRGYAPEDVPASEVGDFASGQSLALYRAYQQRLSTLNACDFGDLLLHPLMVLRRHADLLERYQTRFRAILVDEYQDTNVAQYLWLRLLAQRHKNITCVGDDDQSIYSWRGAEVGNILRFEQDFPGAGVVRLERNYRSTGSILGTASGLIARNQARLGKTLWTEGEAGTPVRIAGLWDEAEEARYIGDEIEALQRGGESLAQIAVLVRAGFQTRAIEERFRSIHLPYRIVGGLRFYERAHNRDATAYLRIVNQPFDDLAFERIVNLPRRSIGETTLRRLHDLGRATDVSLTIAARQAVETDELAPRARNALRQFLADIDRWRNKAEELSPRELAEMVLDESGYTQMWQDDQSPQAPGRLDDLKEYVRGMDEHPTLAAFLEHVSLVTEVLGETGEEQVSVMTLHGAKGLEFNCVFLTGWEEGLFPNSRALQESSSNALEEERRLAYVGLTRARHRCTVSFAANRRIYNQWSSSVPSRFIEELPVEHVEHLHRNPAMRPDAESFMDDLLVPQVARFRSRRAELGKVIEGRAEILTTPPRASANFSIGDRIFHQKFGYGRVAAVDGNKLEIAFEKSGVKKVISSFVEAA